MSTLYLEPFSGLSGDMLNALLLDLGADRKHLEEALKTIFARRLSSSCRPHREKQYLGNRLRCAYGTW